MTFDDYLLHLFYLVDAEYAALDMGRLRRRRGPLPALHDSEVLTMELAGEFLGIDTDRGIYRFFRRYHLAEFPALARVGRTTFVRQAANLWRVGQLLHRRLLGHLPLRDEASGEALWLVDSFPLHVCRFARAKGSKLFKGTAAYGHDHVARGTFFGFRVHVRCADRGPVAQVELAAADVSDPAAAAALAPPGGGGVGIGGRNYWGPDRQADLARRGFVLLAPYRNKSRDPNPARSRALTRLRRTAETVIGQLAGAVPRQADVGPRPLAPVPPPRPQGPQPHRGRAPEPAGRQPAASTGPAGRRITRTRRELGSNRRAEPHA